MGGKVLWKVISNREHWINQVLRKKYLIGMGSICLEKIIIPDGSPLWNLCKKGLEFFLDHLYWIPGNGENIKIWEDKILDHPPLSRENDLEGI